MNTLNRIIAIIGSIISLKTSDTLDIILNTKIKFYDANKREKYISELTQKKLNDLEKVVNILLKQFSYEKNINTKNLIVYTLGEIGSEKALDILNECVQHQDSETRLIALKALGKISTKNKKGAEILISCFGDICNSKTAIISSLANYQYPEVIKILITSWINSNENISVRREAYLSLEKMGVVNDIEIFLQYHDIFSKKQIDNPQPKVLIDASLILDALLDRPSIFLDDAKEIMEIVASGSMNGYIAEMGLRDIWEVMRKIKSLEYANHLLVKILKLFRVCKIDSALIKRAHEYHLNSFETGIQVECAKENNLDLIITLRTRDFLSCGWQNVVYPSHFLQDKNSIYLSNLNNSLEMELVKTELNQIVKQSITKIEEKKLVQQYKAGERDFSKVNLREANLVGENFPEIDFRISDLSFSNLQGINLSKASLTEAIFMKAIVTEANLTEAILCRAKLNNAILRNSELVQADLSKADLFEVNLTNANLSNADLTGANLTNANLSNADLTGANLTNANLSNADLTGANLTNANLSGAFLIGVDFGTTTIYGANLSEANLSQADLSALDLDKTVFCKPILTDTKMPEIKVEIYGNKRIERIIQLFEQFNSDHYVIYAVHSSTIGSWWNSPLAHKFRQVNQELSNKGITIKRVFIIPQNHFSQEINEIIKEQVECGIKVRCLPEDLAENLDGYDLRKNFLVCKNVSVAQNSLTTMMLVNQEQEEEENGYISYKRSDIELNERLFAMIWENAKPYFDYLEEFEKTALY